MVCSCGKPIIGKDKYCSDCRTKMLETKIKDSIVDSTMTVLVGHSLAKETGKSVINVLNESDNVKNIVIKARGQHITKAVDILEIIKRTIKHESITISTDTNELISNDNRKINVSCVEIVFVK